MAIILCPFIWYAFWCRNHMFLKVAGLVFLVSQDSINVAISQAVGLKCVSCWTDTSCIFKLNDIRCEVRQIESHQWLKRHSALRNVGQDSVSVCDRLTSNEFDIERGCDQIEIGCSSTWILQELLLRHLVKTPNRRFYVRHHNDATKRARRMMDYILKHITVA